MKILVALCLTFSIASAQLPPLDPPKFGKAMSFGGSDYFTATNPNGFVMNGSSLFTNLNFETGDTTGWSRNIYAEIAIVNTPNRVRSGSYSMAVISKRNDQACAALTASSTESTQVSKKGVILIKGYAFLPTTNGTGSISLAICDQNGNNLSSGNISLTKGSWQAFQAIHANTSGTQTALRVKAGPGIFAVDDTAYFDDLRIEQMYEYAVIGLTYPRNTATRVLFYVHDDSVADYNQFGLHYNSTGAAITAAAADAAASTGESSLAASIGRWSFNGLGLYRRAGSARQYAGGTATNTVYAGATQFITWRTFKTLYVGGRFPGAYGNPFIGEIAQIQVVRFLTMPTNIDALMAGIGNAAKNKDLPTWTGTTDGAVVVAQYDFRTSANLLDLSGMGNHLTGTVGSPRLVRTRY